MPSTWEMQGTLLGACSCDWGCPCSFDAAPTQGYCEGSYVWHVEKGRYGNVPLDGLTFSWMAHSPGPLHLGNVTSVISCDVQSTAGQRAALETIFEGKSGGPWMILSAVTVRKHGPHYVPFDLNLDGLHSKVTAEGVMEMELGPILNPVTREPEEIYLDKPTGFTSKRLTLGVNRRFRVTSEIAFDHSGKYGEYSKFAYSGESSD